MILAVSAISRNIPKMVAAGVVGPVGLVVVRSSSSGGSARGGGERSGSPCRSWCSSSRWGPSARGRLARPGSRTRQDPGDRGPDRLDQGQHAERWDDGARAVPQHGDVDRHPVGVPGDPGPPLPRLGRPEGSARDAQRERHADGLRRRRQGADQGQPVQRLLGGPDRRADEGRQRAATTSTRSPVPDRRRRSSTCSPRERLHRDRHPELRRTERHDRCPHLPGRSDKLEISLDRMFIAAEALERLVEHSRWTGNGKVAAGNLLDRIVPPATGPRTRSSTGSSSAGR